MSAVSPAAVLLPLLPASTTPGRAASIICRNCRLAATEGTSCALTHRVAPAWIELRSSQTDANCGKSSVTSAQVRPHHGMDRRAEFGHEIDQSPAAATDGKCRTPQRYRRKVGDLLVLEDNNLHGGVIPDPTWLVCSVGFRLWLRSVALNYWARHAAVRHPTILARYGVTTLTARIPGYSAETERQSDKGSSRFSRGVVLPRKRAREDRSSALDDHLQAIRVERPSRSGGMADAPDSKSGARKGVRVQVPPSVIYIGKLTSDQILPRGFAHDDRLSPVPS